MLIKHNNMDQLLAIAANINGDGNTSDSKFLSKMASLVYDKSYEILLTMYQQIRAYDLPMNTTLYNYFIMNAV